MQVFINEKSLQRQFDDTSIESAVKTFIGTLSILEKAKDRGAIFKSNLFFNEQAIDGVHLNSILNKNGDLRLSFLNNLKSAERWESSKVHDSEIIYSYEEECVTDTSVAEIAERKLQNEKLLCVLINFTNSTYSKNEIIVKKEEDNKINVDCSHDEPTLINWLRVKNLLNDPYDESKKLPPEDHQTVLGGPEFEITTFKNKGRRAYRLIGTNQLWAVDASEGHLFGKPHIEVFSEIDGKHMGTSLYNEINLDRSRKVNLRKININKHYPLN